MRLVRGCGDGIAGCSCGGCAAFRGVLEVLELHDVSEFCLGYLTL